MTINKLKKRYYSLSFITAIIVSLTIITIDKEFNTFVFVPLKYNKKLKNELTNKQKEQLLYEKKINELKKKNNIYLTYIIKKDSLEKELKNFFTIFSNKVKIVKIVVVNVKLDPKYFNKARIILKSSSNSQYITTKFAVDMTIELIKELFGKNASNIKDIGNGQVEFTYINYFKK